MRDVLERDEISGINRKLQMKPEKWRDTVRIARNKEDGGAAEGDKVVETRASEVLIILKWGGGLTPLGRMQAENLGATFRTDMYPDQGGGGVLRLHSTFRHDLKIKASDEGRVMKTAAAFTKGLLELEGSLTPVLVSLVTVQEKNNQMLDHYDNSEIKLEVDRCKEHVSSKLQMDQDFTAEMLHEITPLDSSCFHARLLKLGNPRQTLVRMHALIGNICQELKDRLVVVNDPSSPESSPGKPRANSWQVDPDDLADLSQNLDGRLKKADEESKAVTVTNTTNDNDNDNDTEADIEAKTEAEVLHDHDFQSPRVQAYASASATSIFKVSTI